MNPVIESNQPTISALELWTSLAATVALLIYWWWMKRDASAFLSKPDEKKGSNAEPPQPEYDWSLLRTRAETIISQTRASLPEPIKLEVDKVPCIFHHWSQRLRGSNSLGLYTGFQPNRMPGESSRITIFLGNLFRYCDEDLEEFDKEVRTTFLHEIGHHFGWDEDELEERGLG